MPGLFGFFLRVPREAEWAPRRFAQMAAGLPQVPGHQLIHVETPHGWVGQAGPGILPGSLALHGDGSGATLLAEGECYHHDHLLAPGESAGGPWRWLLGEWRRRGGAAVRDLDGLYTLALLETSPPCLRLVNDRYGSRRLYVIDAPEAFVFASELGPLLAWPEAGDIDAAYVRQLVCLGSPLDGRTWLSGVRLMPPGTEYVVTPGRATSASYWRWEDLAPARRAASGDAVLTPDERAALAEGWESAMRARLKGGRLGQLLSGGLDSRLILATATAMHGRDWITVTYGEPGADEVRFAQAAAAAAGAPWLHWSLPEPAWLEARTAFCLRHDGVVDIVNAYAATLADRLPGLLTWEVNGYLGDLVLGATYEVRSVEEAMAHLPYWHSPLALPEPEVRQAIRASIGDRSPKAWLIDTKCRRAINAWPHVAVDRIEVRKPFMDYALVERAATLPVAARARREPHRFLLSLHPALAAVPWQKTGVAPGASPGTRWAMRARRVAYRAMRAGLDRVGVAWPAWVRGAVDLDRWITAPDVVAELRDRLLAPAARVGAWYSRQAIADTLQATMVERRVAHEPLLHLYLVERMVAHLAERRSHVAATTAGTVCRPAGLDR